MGEPDRERGGAGARWRRAGGAAVLLLALYVAGFVARFELTGLPVRSQSAWVGPSLRGVDQGPDLGEFKAVDEPPPVYRGYAPLCRLWLRAGGYR